MKKFQIFVSQFKLNRFAVSIILASCFLALMGWAVNLSLSATVVSANENAISRIPTASVIITPTNGLITAENSETDATFTVTLDMEPTLGSVITIPVTSTNTAEGEVNPELLIFNNITGTANWNIPRTITVSSVDDDVDDGDIIYSIEVGPVEQTVGSEYDGQGPFSVEVTNVDDDTKGISAAPSNITTSEPNVTATFAVSLTSQPTATVSITVSSSNDSEGTVSPAMLSFDEGNWNVGQPVTVTGSDDDIADGDQPYTIDLVASGGGYNGESAQVSAINNEDNDTRSVSVGAISGNTSEVGITATFTVALTSQPTATVSIPVSSSDMSEGTIVSNTLSFTADNWEQPQSVIVTGQNDDIDDGNIPYTITLSTASGGGYDGVDPSDVAVLNEDDDTRNVTVGTISGNTTEDGNGTATFTVVLDSEPTADVSIAVSSNDTSEGTVSPEILTFTPNDWNKPITVTVTGVDDDVDDDDVTYMVQLAAATGGDYAGIDPDDVTVTNIDDDGKGVTSGAISGNTTEARVTATFTVVLDSEPTANVTIQLSSNDTTEGTVSPITLSFTANNWDDPQTVTVTGEDDDIDDGNINYQIEFDSVNGGDYTDVVVASVPVTNIDDDERGVMVIGATNLETDEDGSTATFTIKLDSQPTANVSVPLNSSDTTEGTVSPSSLTFTPSNWNTPQSVTITGEDDEIDDDDVEYTIIIGTTSGGDYSGDQAINPPDVTVVNRDRDSRILLPVVFYKYQPLRNGGFETGALDSWAQSGVLATSVSNSLDIDGNAGGNTANPIAGNFSALLGNPNYNNNGGVPVGFGEISQSVIVPGDATHLRLQYRLITHDEAFSTSNNRIFDTFEVYLNSTTATQGQYVTRCNNERGLPSSGESGLVLCDGNVNATRLNPPADLGVKTIDIPVSGRVGDTVSLYLRVYNRVDGRYNTWVYVDGIEFVDTP